MFDTSTYLGNTPYKAPNKTLFWSFYVSFCTFYASLRLTRTVFTRLQLKIRPKGLHKSLTPDPWPLPPLPRPLTPNPSPLTPNIIVHNDLRAYKTLYNCKETFTDVMSALQNNLFMQNKANFRKVKLNVSPVNTKDYDQLDTWSIRKTKPIQSQSKPIQSQLKPILCQNKANSNPIKANLSKGQK